MQQDTREMSDAERFPLGENEILFIKGSYGTVGVVKAGPEPQFFLETESEEIVLGLETEDLIIASAFFTGKVAENGLKCILYTIRELRSPMIVLPPDHPASKRLKTVVSAGNSTQLSCEIIPGTHPDQNVLCSTEDFKGLRIKGICGGIEVMNRPDCEIKKCRFEI